MPIYTYRCEHCGVQFERQQSFQDEPLKICPECRKKALKKVIAPVGIVFKGSGFYATDHRSASGGGSRSSRKEESKEAAPKKEESKSEAAAKPEKSSTTSE